MTPKLCENPVMQLDSLDREILTALHVDGRAPWPKIADQVGSSVSTVRRRFESLLGRGLVRVIGRTDVARLGYGPPAMIAFRGRDALRPEFAAALQRNDHVRYVAATLGSAHCLAEIVPTSLTSLREILSGIGREFEVASESFVVTHTYTSGQDWLPVRAHRTIDTSTRPASISLSTEERTVLAALLRDGRASFASMAAAVQRSENTVRRIVEHLLEDEVVSLRVLVEPELLDFEALFWTLIDVEPSQLPRAAEALAGNQATKTLFATAGSSNLIGQFVLPRHTDTYAFTTEVLGELPGARSAETLLEAETYKRVWNVVDHGAYTDICGPEWLFGRSD